MNKPLVRLVLAISIDGRIAPPEGGKAQLGGHGDRKVLEEALAWSDATLVGAETIRQHKSICLIKKPSLIEERKLQGKASQPITIVVGNKLIFSTEWPFFSQPISRWILTKPNCDKQSSIKKGYERIFYLKPTWVETLSNLHKEGISKIALLGGAKLAESLINENQVDEIQITITPKLLGGKKIWFSTHQNNNVPIQLWNENDWKLNKIKPLLNSEIMLRYSRIN